MYLGSEICLSNRHIRKMLRLAKASGRDVFYDLGCGRAQLCVIAVVEFGVKRAVGIELNLGRARKAIQYVKSLGLSHRIEIRHEDFHQSDLADATVIYKGLMEEEDDDVESKLRKGCRFVTLFLPFIGVMPDAQDYPFYLMKAPFRKTRNISTWVSAVLAKKATVEEFFGEVRSDPDYHKDMRILKSLMRKRFDMRVSL